MVKGSCGKSEVFPEHSVTMRSRKRGILRADLASQRCRIARWLRLILTIVSGIGATATIHATPIEIDLGSSPKITSDLSVPFNALNGTDIGGQTLSFDLAFSNSEFVRLFTITSPSFEVFIRLQTNGSGPLDLLQGTGNLIDSQNNAIPGFGVTGSASGDNLLAIGLFPLLKDQNGTPNNDLPRPLDFSGIHFELMFPDVGNPSVHVTGGEFELISNPGAGFGPG